MENAVETFSLTKVFSDWWGRAKVYAVEDLDLQVRYNEIFGLLGPNGSGKTTTLKMLLGLLFPTRGKAVVLGGNGADPKINARIGFLPEESYLYRYLTARETLDFYGRLFALPAKVRKMRIEALLDMVGLTAVAGRPVGTFSKGMARRIGLAQALINDPDLLILDEPTTGLDPIGTRQIKDLIGLLAKRGKTILLCSHLLADVEDVCDRIAILYGGRIQSQGNVRQLLQQTGKRQITTGAISEVALESIKRIIRGENCQFDIVEPMDRLETFFIKTVAAAQQEERTTSGAVSTTQIGDFLTGSKQQGPSSADILKELVCAPVLEQGPETRAVDEPRPAAQQTSEGRPDQELLSKLTSRSEVVQTQPVHKDDKIDSARDAEQKKTDEKAKDSVLDRLTGKPASEEGSEQNRNGADSTGDCTDA